MQERLQHQTCTSSSLDNSPGSTKERVDRASIDHLHEEQTGIPISQDPLVALIQREQAIARLARQERQSKSGNA